MRATLYDTHAHAQFNAFKEDGIEVVKKSVDQGVWVNLVGTQIDTSKRAVEYAEQFDEGVYAIVGLHPTHLFSTFVDEDEIYFQSREEAFDPKLYHALAESKKVVGIGECGLDYYRMDQLDQSEDVVKQKQKNVFRQHLDLAHELTLPLSIHCRDGSNTLTTSAYDDLFEVIAAWKKERGVAPRGVMHCYVGTWEQARRFLDLGLYISFSGIVTFKNARDLHAVAKHVSLDRMLIETDCPYLTPEPHRGKKRNEPIYVEYVAQKIAELHGRSFEEVARITTKNAQTLFLPETA